MRELDDTDEPAQGQSGEADDPYATDVHKWWHLSRPSPELLTALDTAWLAPPGRVLDLGCGLGTELAFLAGQGFTPIGVDLSLVALQRAHALHPSVGFAQVAYMSTAIPTSIQPVLNEYIRLTTSALPGFLAGFYLHGSLALNAFNPHFSDIDFVAVASRFCIPSDIARLRTISPRKPALGHMPSTIRPCGGISLFKKQSTSARGHTPHSTVSASFGGSRREHS